jgi:hypothetical protein
MRVVAIAAVRELRMSVFMFLFVKLSVPSFWKTALDPENMAAATPKLKAGWRIVARRSALNGKT